ASSWALKLALWEMLFCDAITPAHCRAMFDSVASRARPGTPTVARTVLVRVSRSDSSAEAAYAGAGAARPAKRASMATAAAPALRPLLNRHALHAAPRRPTSAPPADATAARTRGRGPNTSLPWGRRWGRIGARRGASMMTPAAKVDSRATASAQRSPRRGPP